MRGTPISGLPPWTTQSGGTGGLVGKDQEIPISNNDTETYPNRAYRLNVNQLSEYTKTQHKVESIYLGNDLVPLNTLKLSLIGVPDTNKITIIGGTIAQNQYAVDRIAINSLIGPMGGGDNKIRIVKKSGMTVFLDSLLMNASWDNLPYEWYPPLISNRNTNDVSYKNFSVDANGVLHNEIHYGMFSLLYPPDNGVIYSSSAAGNIPSIASGWTQLKFRTVVSNGIKIGEDPAAGSFFDIVENGIYQVNFHCETQAHPAIPISLLSVAAIMYDSVGAPGEYSGGSSVEYNEAPSLRIFSPVLSFMTRLERGSKMRLWATQSANTSPIPILGPLALNTTPITSLSIHRLSDVYFDYN